jgi:XTP/dITP diphosphohydrolase
VAKVKVGLASANRHKLAELSVLLPGWEVEPLDMEGGPVEGDESYHANARAKARFGRMIGEFDLWMLGEDSGLEVEGLGGGPGVRSARLAGEGASDRDNVDLLLRTLEGRDADERRARYVCELVCISPELEEYHTRGELAGSIAEAPRGEGGFGYDPVFVPNGETRTVAELGDEWKREHGHRAAAARTLRRIVGEGTGGD